jgi:hypothetical protein
LPEELKRQNSVLGRSIVQMHVARYGAQNGIACCMFLFLIARVENIIALAVRIANFD